MNGFESYKLYYALRLHFTSKYDYFQYNGKTTVNQQTFLVHKNKHSFEKIAKKYNENVPGFFLANMVENPKVWIFDLSSSESHDIFIEWQKRTQSLGYVFEEDVDKLFRIGNINKVTEVKTSFPILLTNTLRKDICIETLIIINNALNIFNMWNSKIEDDVIWKEFRQKCLKYSPFLNYDEKKYKLILKKKAKEYA